MADQIRESYASLVKQSERNVCGAFLFVCLFVCFLINPHSPQVKFIISVDFKSLASLAARDKGCNLI